MTTRALPDPATVEDHLDELAILLPALPAALQRDTGTTNRERVTTSTDVHTLPINTDVATALARLHGLDTEWLLHDFHRIYRAAATNAYPGAAAAAHHAAATIRRHLTDARRALGLDRPDIPLPGPRHCPDHSEPLTPLVTPGDRGSLIYTEVDRTGRPIEPWIRWTHTDIVLCRHCGRSWTPAQYLWLGRLLAHADHRRTQPRTVEG